MLKFRSLSLSVTPPDAIYREPSTGYEVKWETSPEAFFAEIAVHRAAHGLAMEEGWKDEVLNQVCMTLKAQNYEDWCYDPDVPYVSRLSAYGQAMWKELHERALAYPERPDDFDKEAELVWFRGWESRIPSILNCDCAGNWKRLALGLPDFSSRRAYYGWTLTAHDAVRVKLGQSIMDGEFRRLAIA